MNKQVLFSTEGRKQLLKGVNTVGDAVKVTMGAKGRTVIIGNRMAANHITKDGVTVANSINLEDEVQNTGASLVKEVARRTVDEVGDATSASCVLTQSIINEGVKAIENGTNAIELKSGIDKAKDAVVAYLKSVSIETKDDETIRKIATISANNDSYIGGLIHDAVLAVGRSGLIKAGESNTTETSIEVLEGLEIPSGYTNFNFVTNQEKGTAELVNPLILMYDGKVVTQKDIIPIAEIAAQNQRPLLIISDGLEGEAIAFCVVNKMRGQLNVCAINCPERGLTRSQVMEDIAAVTGGVFLSKEKGFNLENVQAEHLGQADRIEITQSKSTIIGGKGKKEEIEARCKQVKIQLDSATNDYEKHKATERLSKLQNGVAILKVGGVTETEINEKKDRVDDAIHATKAAIEEGFVAGGGTTFLHAIKNLEDNKLEYLSHDEKVGGDILIKALKEPFRNILINGGAEPLQYIDKIMNDAYGNGYNIKTNQYCNLIEGGVIDPTKVLRVALENSVSVAGIFLTTECVITDLQTK